MNVYQDVYMERKSQRTIEWQHLTGSPSGPIVTSPPPGCNGGGCSGILLAPRQCVHCYSPLRSLPKVGSLRPGERPVSCQMPTFNNPKNSRNLSKVQVAILKRNRRGHNLWATNWWQLWSFWQNNLQIMSQFHIWSQTILGPEKLSPIFWVNMFK